MNIHEYQAKALFAEHDIPVWKSQVLHMGDDIHAKCNAIKPQECGVKALIHAEAIISDVKAGAAEKYIALKKPECIQFVYLMKQACICRHC